MRPSPRVVLGALVAAIVIVASTSAAEAPAPPDLASVRFEPVELADVGSGQVPRTDLARPSTSPTPADATGAVARRRDLEGLGLFPIPTPIPTPTPRPAPAWHHDPNVSWYGPGFYGKRTACGLAMTTTLVGVAHRTLPCGTLVVFRYGDRIVRARVVDRGPYVAGRTWDLTAGLAIRLGHLFTGPLDWRLP